MSKLPRERTRSEQGFTLIEVLVVVLIIGILAAIAIPSFLSQKGKAVDASAKEVARTGSQAAETYSTDHGGEYNGIEPSALREYEPALRVEADPAKDAYLSVAESTEAGGGYKVTATSGNGDTFSYTKSRSGTVTRSCELAPGSPPATCQSGSW